jgi:hypothetical protein
MGPFVLRPIVTLLTDNQISETTTCCRTTTHQNPDILDSACGVSTDRLQLSITDHRYQKDLPKHDRETTYVKRKVNIAYLVLNSAKDEGDRRFRIPAEFTQRKNNR